MKEIDKEVFKTVADSIINRFNNELFALAEPRLEEKFFFKWDDTISLEYNLYEFSDNLELFKESCEKWERHHNGSTCIVERVRDKYLMPKIRAFMADLRFKLNKEMPQ